MEIDGAVQVTRMDETVKAGLVECKEQGRGCQIVEVAGDGEAVIKDTGALCL